MGIPCQQCFMPLKDYNVLNNYNVFLALVHKKLEETNRRIMVEMEEERQHHQKLVKDYGRLQQRLENVKGIEDFFRICDTNLCNFYIKTSVESRP